jgi:hypothetical protein
VTLLCQNSLIEADKKNWQMQRDVTDLSVHVAKMADWFCRFFDALLFKIDAFSCLHMMINTTTFLLPFLKISGNFSPNQ